MHGECYGKGPRTVVALHGWGGDHREFAPLAAHRPPDGRVLSFDLPGYGRSPRPSAWTAEGVVAPLAAALDQWALGPVPVAAFCSGAFPALRLARTRPDLVSRLVLIDPFARVPWYLRHFTWGWFGRRAYHATFHGAAGRALTNGALRKRQGSGADVTAAFMHRDPDVVLAYLKLFATHVDRRLFGDLALPVDLVYGAHTFRAVRASVREFAAQWPQARIHRLDGVGHLSLVQGAHDLARILFPDPEGAA